MPPFAKIAIGLARDLCLPESHGLNDYPSFAEKIVEATSGYWVAPTVNHNGRLHIIDGRDSTHFVAVDSLRNCWRFRLGSQNGDDGRGIQDHFGIPFSSYNSSPWSMDR